MWSTPLKASKTSGRSRPWVSEMTPTRMPLQYKSRMELRVRTPVQWVRLAVERFDEVLVDHAHCEKKAAAQALSMLAAFPEVAGLPRAMARLAREEAGTCTRSWRLWRSAAFRWAGTLATRHAQALQSEVRQPARERLLDRLLVSERADRERESEERLHLLAAELPDAELRGLLCAARRRRRRATGAVPPPRAPVLDGCLAEGASTADARAGSAAGPDDPATCGDSLRAASPWRRSRATRASGTCASARAGCGIVTLPEAREICVTCWARPLGASRCSVRGRRPAMAGPRASRRSPAAASWTAAAALGVLDAQPAAAGKRDGAVRGHQASSCGGDERGSTSDGPALRSSRSRWQPPRAAPGAPGAPSSSSGSEARLGAMAGDERDARLQRSQRAPDRGSVACRAGRSARQPRARQARGRLAPTPRHRAGRRAGGETWSTRRRAGSQSSSASSRIASGEVEEPLGLDGARDAHLTGAPRRAASSASTARPSARHPGRQLSGASARRRPSREQDFGAPALRDPIGNPARTATRTASSRDACPRALASAPAARAGPGLSRRPPQGGDALEQVEAGRRAGRRRPAPRGAVRQERRSGASGCSTPRRRGLDDQARLPRVHGEPGEARPMAVARSRSSTAPRRSSSRVGGLQRGGGGGIEPGEEVGSRRRRRAARAAPRRGPAAESPAGRARGGRRSRAGCRGAAQRPGAGAAGAARALGGGGAADLGQLERGQAGPGRVRRRRARARCRSPRRRRRW